VAGTLHEPAKDEDSIAKKSLTRSPPSSGNLEVFEKFVPGINLSCLKQQGKPKAHDNQNDLHELRTRAFLNAGRRTLFF
jgi:hypothetical protein